MPAANMLGFLLNIFLKNALVCEKLQEHIFKITSTLGGYALLMFPFK